MADMTSYPTDALKDALKRLNNSTFLPEAATHLETHSGAINADLGEIVLAEIPASAASWIVSSASGSCRRMPWT